ncbi:ABC transporter permease [Schleiferilactobacillus shenzhenensis]|uniref:ABC3 transporter permease C-terminal domain-containing protein n=1 Tax=Schleiferilactobacillus shenzhenensis LY-73 TaxID=1231336 RepID=U4TPG3_9LACO|nr:ABC transporter permease [Schleiferilactobacillus shenzhenensis]ERL65310.1 hypothetical protein L248_2709 [Schleiferilactobacillus shenzhenensis LY-73]
MGIINRLTKRTLQGEMGRTLLTIVSMGIAATLVVATLVGFTSSQKNLYEYSIQDTGGMQFVIQDVPRANVQKLRQDPAVTRSLAFSNLGTAALPKGYQNYVGNGANLVGMDPTALRQLVGPQLVAGRLPRTPSELVVPSDARSGKPIKLETIRLTIAGKNRSFRIVGVINGYHTFSSAYRWITYNDQPSTGTVSIAGSFASVTRLQQRVQALATANGVNQAATKISFNDRALSWLGAGGNLRDMVTVSGLLLFALIVIGLAAGMMIYTSINLGVRARTQRYGLLRSIGATPKQVRQLVYREALALVLPALGLGYLAGTGGIAVVLELLNRNFGNSKFPFHLYFTLSPWALIGSAVFMIIVTFLASARPAQRAARVTPLVAVRDNLATPRLRSWQMRTGLWGRLMPTPLSRLAAKNYRRNSGTRWTMIATLSVSILIFVGFTGFARAVLKDTVTDYGHGADLYFTLPDTPHFDTIATAIDRTDNVQASLATKRYDFQINKRPPGFASNIVPVFVVPDKTFASQFNGQVVLLNPSHRVITKGQRRQVWGFPTQFSGPLDFAELGKLTVSKTVPADTPLLRAAASYNGGVVISESILARSLKKTKIESPTVEYNIMLRDTRQHGVTFKKLQNLMPTDGYDVVANDEKSMALLTAIQVMVYGFLALLSLVSLANIINHIFANLLQRRRELAMLQAIGTTPGQVTRLLGLENGRLLLISLIWGSVLGTLLNQVLLKRLSTIYEVAFAIPWLEIGIVVFILFVVWAVFSLVSYRMIRRQNIDHWLRLT